MVNHYIVHNGYTDWRIDADTRDRRSILPYPASGITRTRRRLSLSPSIALTLRGILTTSYFRESVSPFQTTLTSMAGSSVNYRGNRVRAGGDINMSTTIHMISDRPTRTFLRSVEGCS